MNKISLFFYKINAEQQRHREKKPLLLCIKFDSSWCAVAHVVSFTLTGSDQLARLKTL
jgi:hypothetical protein